jgi:hypothetical protein
MRPLPLITLCALPLLVGCADFVNPYYREGNWRPTGANDFNLRVMAAQPRDIAAGSAEAGSDGQAAADAVDRLRTDRVRPLPVMNVSPVAPTPPGQGGSGGGAGSP